MMMNNENKLLVTAEQYTSIQPYKMLYFPNSNLLANRPVPQSFKGLLLNLFVKILLDPEL